MGEEKEVKPLEIRFRIKKYEYLFLLQLIREKLATILKKKRPDYESNEIKDFYLFAERIASVKHGRHDSWAWYDRAGMKQEISSLIKKIDEKIKETKVNNI